MKHRKIQRRKEIFISYAREDGDAAETIKELLLNHGYKVWLDIDNGMTGEVFLDVIRQKLNEVDFVILIISKESIKPNRVVADEFDIALKIQRNFRDKRIYLLPVKIDDCIYPGKLQPYGWTFNNDAGRKKILDTIFSNPGRTLDEEQDGGEPEPVSWWKKKTVHLTVFLFLLLAFLMFYYVFYRERTLHLKVAVSNFDSGYRIPGVIACMLGETNDTIVKSLPSALDGVVAFELDSFPRTAFTIRFYHAEYIDTVAHYKLTEEAGYRYIKMRRKQPKKQLPVVSAPSKTFKITGLQPTPVELQQVKNQTGYSWNAGSANLLQFEFDQGAYLQVNGTDHYTFAGSTIWLVCNGNRTDTRILLPAVTSPPFPKRQLEDYLRGKTNDLIDNNRQLVIKTLIQCLQNI